MKHQCCDCCNPANSDNAACGCCEGIEVLTPMPTANRPGLSSLEYRIGTHASFLESMLARLSSSDYSQLRGLTTRAPDDPSIALLDSWATVADVLTFYQERIVNEGYLRTATERRSVLELARLVGYRLRPGVSASVYLAYALDENSNEETIVPKGSRAQSVPGPDELPQSFETSEDLLAKSQWNNLAPRMSQPQTDSTILNGTPASAIGGPRVYLQGVETNLKISDRMLIQFGSAPPRFATIVTLVPDAPQERTLVQFDIAGMDSGGGGSTDDFRMARFDQMISQLSLPASQQPRSSVHLKRKLKDQFALKSWPGYRALHRFAPRLRDTLSAAAANAQITPDTDITVYALRQRAALFGRTIPRRTRISINGGPISDGGEWPVIEATDSINGGGIIAHEEEQTIFLDAAYETIKAGDWIVIDTPQTSRLTNRESLVVRVGAVDASGSRAKYGAAAPTTRIDIDFSASTTNRWILISDNLGVPSDVIAGDDFQALRGTTVYAQPEQLELAEEPIEQLVCGGANDAIELNGFYEGLEAGRWVIVSGERHIDGTSGVRFSELAMLSSVTQDIANSGDDVFSTDTGQTIARAGEKNHTFITLANELAYCFKRESVHIHGNVVDATHGETRIEVLGSGDGAKALQSFDLKQKPLTHVSAANPTGVDSTLKVIVNDLQWHEADSLADRVRTDRNFITKTDNEDTTTVIFGNGINGSRLPTGNQNVRAEYRAGIGQGGNVKAQQITLLQSKPLGVKEVINPLRASGGANRENMDQARKNTPLAVTALDRLVSVQDYEDFSRTYAGIGKAKAIEISDGRRQFVHVTIAGSDDIPIDKNSDLYRNLFKALHTFGDPQLPIRLNLRELMLLVISAKIKLLPDYQWKAVVGEIRAALLLHFGFEHRELAQSVLLSEVFSVMHGVRGVSYVDVETFGGIPEKSQLPTTASNGETELAWRLLTPDEVSQSVLNLIGDSEDSGRPAHRVIVSDAGILSNAHGAMEQPIFIRPAQLAFLSGDVPETLILNQIE